MKDQVINSISMEFKSIPENVSLARVVVAAVAAQLDLTVNDLEELKVATSEAVSNAIIHGYQNNPDQTVKLNVCRYIDSLVISVIDTGVGINDIDAAMEPENQKTSEHMGLGFVFMRTFMDRVEVFSEPHQGTRVTMVKNLEVRQES